MTNHFALSLIRRAAVAAVASTLLVNAAPPPVKTHWSQLAAHLYDKYVTITLKTGVSTQGKFVSSSPSDITLDGGKSVARDTILGISFTPIYKSNLERLGGVLQKGYKDSFRDLFSPMAPAGIVGVPAVTAYAVVATPFCALGDLFSDHKTPEPTPVEILPDPIEDGESK